MRAHCCFCSTSTETLRLYSLLVLPSLFYLLLLPSPLWRFRSISPPHQEDRTAPKCETWKPTHEHVEKVTYSPGCFACRGSRGVSRRDRPAIAANMFPQKGVYNICVRMFQAGVAVFFRLPFFCFFFLLRIFPTALPRGVVRTEFTFMFSVTTCDIPEYIVRRPIYVRQVPVQCVVHHRLPLDASRATDGCSLVSPKESVVYALCACIYY